MKIVNITIFNEASKKISLCKHIIKHVQLTHAICKWVSCSQGLNSASHASVNDTINYLDYCGYKANAM